MTAIEREPSLTVATAGMIRSSSSVDRFPARKSSWATMCASTGMVVRMPTTLYSASARDIRWIAAARSAPQTMSLASSVS